MQVRILKDIFNKEDNQDELNNLLKYFRTGKHNLILDDYDDIQALESSKWYSEINRGDADVIKRSIISTSKRNTNAKIITVSETDDTTYYRPKEADKYLDQPLSIILENSNYDRPFLNAIFRLFDKSGIILNAQKEMWLKYSMGGGSSIGNVIQGDLQSSYVDDCFTKDKKVYLRYYAVLDSDKIHPSMTYESVSATILTANDVSYHVLYKREMENYVPYSILRSFKDPYLDIYLKFKNQEHRDFFDLEKCVGNYPRENNKSKKTPKKGTPKEPKKGEKDHLAFLEFYSSSSISDDEWSILKKGMQLNQYKSGMFKKEFSKIFDDPNTTSDSILEVIKDQPKHGDLNEFEYIVSEIKKLL